MCNNIKLYLQLLVIIEIGNEKLGKLYWGIPEKITGIKKQKDEIENYLQDVYFSLNLMILK